jgi:Yip1 domain
MNLVSRIQGILTSPRTEWPIIAQERSDPQSIFVNYVVPLVAIGPICTFLGLLIFGVSVPGMGTVRLGISTLITQLVMTYVLGLVLTGVMGFVVAKLAPTFGGQDDIVAGLKLVAYSYTAVWLAAAVSLLTFLPYFLSGLILLAAAIYTIYTAYLGFPTLMRNPPEKTVVYMIVVAVVAVGLALIVGFVVSGVMTGMMMVGR